MFYISNNLCLHVRQQIFSVVQDRPRIFEGCDLKKSFWLIAPPRLLGRLSIMFGNHAISNSNYGGDFFALPLDRLLSKFMPVILNFLEARVARTAERSCQGDLG